MNKIYTINKCDNCDNPMLMYWCERCKCSQEYDNCDACGRDMIIDKDYHLNCNN